MERGIVRGRVASLLRSSEIKPYVLLICTFFVREICSRVTSLHHVSPERTLDIEKIQVFSVSQGTHTMYHDPLSALREPIGSFRVLIRPGMNMFRGCSLNIEKIQVLFLSRGANSATRLFTLSRNEPRDFLWKIAFLGSSTLERSQGRGLCHLASQTPSVCDIHWAWFRSLKYFQSIFRPGSQILQRVFLRSPEMGPGTFYGKFRSWVHRL